MGSGVGPEKVSRELIALDCKVAPPGVDFRAVQNKTTSHEQFILLYIQMHFHGYIT